MSGSQTDVPGENHEVRLRGKILPLLDRQLPPSGLDIPMPPVKPPRGEVAPRPREQSRPSTSPR